MSASTPPTPPSSSATGRSLEASRFTERAGAGVEGSDLWGLMAEFETPAAIYDAATRVREEGYRWWDCHVPFPVHGLDKAMGIKPTILPILVFFGGLTGLIAGIVLQWFTNAESFDLWALVTVRGYDFLVSGKPFASVPAWVPVSPPKKTRIGRIVARTPIALSSPCTGNGTWQSHQR